ncbi:MAG: hypothetical protein IT233_10965 [Bacteroidia bacterium]|nr:hypothetical protein [Bacteroidia bacterium]
MKLFNRGLVGLFVWLTVIVVFPSCMMEKRLYRPGYYTIRSSFRSANDKISEPGSVRRSHVNAPYVNSSEVVINEKGETEVVFTSRDSIVPNEQITESVVSCSRISLLKEHHLKYPELFQTRLVRNKIILTGAEGEKRILPKVFIIGGLVFLILGVYWLLRN